MATDPTRPWVLVRKGHHNPPNFATLEEAKIPHNIQRRNRNADADATIFGPGGETWECGRFPWSKWTRTVRERVTASADEPDGAA